MPEALAGAISAQRNTCIQAPVSPGKFWEANLRCGAHNCCQHASSNWYIYARRQHGVGRVRVSREHTWEADCWRCLGGCLCVLGVAAVPYLGALWSDVMFGLHGCGQWADAELFREGASRPGLAWCNSDQQLDIFRAFGQCNSAVRLKLAHQYE